MAPTTAPRPLILKSSFARFIASVILPLVVAAILAGAGVIVGMWKQSSNMESVERYVPAKVFEASEKTNTDAHREITTTLKTISDRQEAKSERIEDKIDDLWSVTVEKQPIGTVKRKRDEIIRRREQKRDDK